MDTSTLEQLENASRSADKLNVGSPPLLLISCWFIERDGVCVAYLTKKMSVYPLPQFSSVWRHLDAFLSCSEVNKA